MGLAAKGRPCLVVSDYPADDELALVLVIPHTTAVRRNRWEVASSVSFLKNGVFHLQQIQPVSLPRLEARLGVLSREEFWALKTPIRGTASSRCMSDTIITVEGLGKRYSLRHQTRER